VEELLPILILYLKIIQNNLQMIFRIGAQNDRLNPGIQERRQDRGTVSGPDARHVES